MMDTPEHPCKLPKDLKMHVFAIVFFLLLTPILFASDAHKKSLFLENITPLIVWPQNNKSDFSICVLNDNALLEALRLVYLGKSITQKPVRISSLVDSKAASQCDILFIGKKTASVTALTLALANKPTLTLGDTEELVKEGVMITMLENDDRIACTINQRAAQQADIRISYLLLESACKVVE